jgi:hypothetical protein
VEDLMRTLALVMWSLTLIWLALSIIGALNFQELYGGWSGAQVIVVSALVGLVPAGIGWWAYRRSLAEESEN